MIYYPMAENSGTEKIYDTSAIQNLLWTIYRADAISLTCRVFGSARLFLKNTVKIFL